MLTQFLKTNSGLAWQLQPTTTAIKYWSDNLDSQVLMKTVARGCPYITSSNFEGFWRLYTVNHTNTLRYIASCCVIISGSIYINFEMTAPWYHYHFKENQKSSNFVSPEWSFLHCCSHCKFDNSEPGIKLKVLWLGTYSK